MYYCDSWPKTVDGSDYNGKSLLALMHSGNSPFHGSWDVNLLIREIEDNLGTHVVDIPAIHKGSNCYGFHLKLSNRPDIVARLARADVNMPDYDGFPIHVQVPEVEFEVAVYKLLRSEPHILVSNLLYYRIPVQHVAPRIGVPKDIIGRRLFVFEKAEGENNVWWILDQKEKAHLLHQAAYIRASLYEFNPPAEFIAFWLRERLFEQKPDSLPIPVAPTREFCIALFTSKIKATIKEIGDMIGWESDNSTVGPAAVVAKQHLLRLIPYIMPLDSSLYRFVLEHGDFGIHNMSISRCENGQPLITSLFDWETGCIVPALLSDPLMSLAVDLTTDETATPSITRVDDDATSEDYTEYSTWTDQYFKALFNYAPTYKAAIQAGKDARYLWFALRDWRGEDSEGYFGNLGAWAEKRIKELSA